MYTRSEICLSGPAMDPGASDSGSSRGCPLNPSDMQAAQLSLESLRFLIDLYPYPVLVTDAVNEHIIAANDAAHQGFPSKELAGQSVAHVLCYEHKLIEPQEMVYFNRNWLILERNPFQWGNEACHIIMLKKPPGMPELSEIYTARDMVALVLHRLRSPLTAMQGYIDLLSMDPDSEQIRKRVAKLNTGMEQLNAMLNELESLHATERDSDPSNLRIDSIARSLVKELDEKERERIDVHLKDRNRVIKGNRDQLSRLVKLLLDNALEHPSGKKLPVIISVESALKISITNFGDPIPEYIRERMFSPFITDKAQHMGLGLTVASIIARQMGITIMLAGNSAVDGITFSLLMPPKCLCGDL